MGFVRLCSIFSTYLSSHRFLFIHRGKNLTRIAGTVSPRRPPVAWRHCNVPVDSLNVPKSTSRRFRHFKHLLRGLFEVKKKKIGGYPLDSPSRNRRGYTQRETTIRGGRVSEADTHQKII